MQINIEQDILNRLNTDFGRAIDSQGGGFGMLADWALGDIQVSLLQKARFAGDFSRREAKAEGAGGHFWHDEALTQTS